MGFFFYGSLRDPEMLETVLGRAPSHLVSLPASLPNHRADYAAGYTFPILVAQPGATAIGILVQGLTAADIERIRYYEDSDYACAQTTVWTQAGDRTAHVYLGTGKISSSGRPWCYDTWRAVEKAALLAVTAHIFDRYYPQTPQSEMERLWPALHAQFERQFSAPGSSAPQA